MASNSNNTASSFSFCVWCVFGGHVSSGGVLQPAAGSDLRFGGSAAGVADDFRLSAAGA